MSRPPFPRPFSSPNAAAGARLGEALRGAEQVLVDDPAEAARRARAILKAFPGSAPATVLLAAARRRQGLAAEARSLLVPLARVQPGDGLIQYELGEALTALGRFDAALEAFRRAVAARPSLAVAWRSLGERLYAAGELAAADEAFARYVGSPLEDPPLVKAAAALQRGDLTAAEVCLTDHIKAQPGDVVAMAMLANAYFLKGRLEAADRVLAICLQRHPSYAAVHGVQASLRERIPQPAAQLIDQLEEAVGREPENVDALLSLVQNLESAGQSQRAISALEAALAATTADPRLWVAYGQELRSVGRGTDAIAAFKQALGLSPGHAEAWFRLADLKTYAFTAEDEAAMGEQLTDEALDDQSRIWLRYALAKSREDASDYAGAFASYAAGAALQRRRLPYSTEAFTDLVRRKAALFTPAFFAERDGGGSPDAAPIFVVSLQRSGSTLVEQILASHSAVEGAGELPYIRDIANRIVNLPAVPGRRPYPERLAQLSPDDRLDFGETYMARALAHRKLGRPRLLDKMPGNFEHVGLVQLIFPKAKIIEVRRHPLACGVGLYRQHFGEGGGFTYDLAEIGQTYTDYVALMDQFDAALPGRMHRVIYEDLVNDTEAEVRRLLAYCDLPFEDACLRPHQTQRAVTTPSAEQVRRPIYRDGLDQWRVYEPWLEPLKTALGQTLETWRSGA